ncbi:MAG: ribose-phosphate diphosphokinase [Chitinivibrionales bacterium]|nr:ribose-phosphate diphosphokinase [Chitinivibrionales bacterium]
MVRPVYAAGIGISICKSRANGRCGASGQIVPGTSPCVARYLPRGEPGLRFCRIPPGGVCMAPDNGEPVFVTPERLAQEQTHAMTPERGRLVLAACQSGTVLAREIAAAYRQLEQRWAGSGELVLMDDIEYGFTDSETCVRIPSSVSGSDVFLVQSLYNPVRGTSVNENCLPLLIAARAFREHGAKHITAITPYLAYSRQDKPTRFLREPTTARLLADLAVTAGIDRLLTWHPHSKQVHGFYGATPLATLEPIDYFVDLFNHYAGRDDVVLVAPDEGAAKMVTRVAMTLNVSSAIAAKLRSSGGSIESSRLIGDFEGKRVAILLDDIIGSGGTLRAAITGIAERSDIGEFHVAASHNLCLDKAHRMLDELARFRGLARVVVTDSIPQTEQFRTLPFFRVRPLAETLARAVNRIHYSRSLSEVFREQQQSGQ